MMPEKSKGRAEFDDDDDYDDRPRKKSKEAKGSSTTMILLIVGGVLGLCLLCGCGSTIAVLFITPTDVKPIAKADKAADKDKIAVADKDKIVVPINKDRNRP